MAVAQFETQLGAILVLQAPEKLGPTPGDEYSDNVMYNIDGRELGESIALSEEPRTSSAARKMIPRKLLKLLGRHVGPSIGTL